MLAYAGLRPGEALALTWEHVKENTIVVEQSASFGEIKSTKTGAIRTVELLSALRHDLNTWRMRSGNQVGLVFPNRESSGPWSRESYKSWERKTFKLAATAIGRSDVIPYTLRHSFASLLIHEGRSVVEVAAQMGHTPTVTLDTYAHVFADLSGERRSADEVVDKARERFMNGSGNVPKLFPREVTAKRRTA